MNLLASVKFHVLPKMQEDTRRMRITTLMYILVSFFYWAGLYLYVPTLPVYIQTRTGDLALIGTVLSMYGLWQLICRLPFGIASDAVGRRKPFIIAGLILLGLGPLVLGTAGSIQGMAVGRAITGAAAATWVPLLVVFGCLFETQEVVRATALLTTVGTFGRMTATSLTATLNQMGGYPLAFFAATGSAVLAILIMVFIPERRRPANQAPISLAKLAGLFKNRSVVVPSLMNAIIEYVDTGTTYAFIPILARSLGANDATLGVLLTVSIFIMLLGNLSAATAIQRIGLMRMLTLSIVLMTTGVLLAAFAPSLAVVFAAQFCVSLSMGIGYPVYMGLSMQNVAENERAAAMGLHQSVYAIGMFAGPWLGGILSARLGLSWMFGLTAGFTLVCGLFGLRWLKRTLAGSSAAAAPTRSTSTAEG
jgi:MFS transporter, DHA1 family, multidrug resistance protein